MRHDLNMRMLDFARFHIGVTEVGGDNSGPVVQAFQKAVDGVASGEPWCMAFIQYIAEQTRIVHGGTIKIHRSESVLQTWLKSPPSSRVLMPTPGAIVLWRHGNTQMGHCGIITDVVPDDILTVEGNTSGLGTGIVREGDGVYLKRRPWDNRTKESTVGDMKLLGFLNAF